MWFLITSNCWWMRWPREGLTTPWHQRRRNLDVELPMLNLQTQTIDDARLTDRDAILIRTDLPPGI